MLYYFLLFFNSFFLSLSLQGGVFEIAAREEGQSQLPSYRLNLTAPAGHTSCVFQVFVVEGKYTRPSSEGWGSSNNHDVCLSERNYQTYLKIVFKILNLTNEIHYSFVGE